MSYDIVKSIVLKDNKVYLTSASNNVYPRTFEKWEVTSFSDIYTNKGKEAVLAAIGENIWDGNYHLDKNGNKLCKLFITAKNFLPQNLNWSNFDSEIAGKFLANAVIKLEENSLADLSEEVYKVLSLRDDPEYILEIAEKKGYNFLNHASKELQQDREFALKVLRAGGEKAWFDYPLAFKTDKEFALEALKYNGCFYRELDASLKGDREIIFEAFKESENKKYHEHLPDLIPKNTFFEFNINPTKPTLDKDFVFNLLDCCPSLHIHRADWLLLDRDIALKVCTMGKWALTDIDSLPDKYLKEKEFQDILISRCNNKDVLDSLKTKFSLRGISLIDNKKNTLNDIISDAAKKHDNQSLPDLKEPGKERE